MRPPPARPPFRLLTMPNGERIQFANNINFIFECHSLQFASPATVSRCGMIFLSDEAVDVDRMLNKWLQTHTASDQSEGGEEEEGHTLVLGHRLGPLSSPLLPRLHSPNGHLVQGLPAQGSGLGAQGTEGSGDHKGGKRGRGEMW